jgi:tRNA(Arg) A34 adenosine deaminase TadA
MTELDSSDEHHLRATFATAESLARAGRLPFASRLVRADGTMHSSAENESQVTGDPTAHAELILLQRASATLSRTELAHMTLYAAAEPCAMCAAAIVWSGVGRLVYGLSAAGVRADDPLPPGMPEPGVQGRALLEATANGPAIIGPALEMDARNALFPDRQKPPTKR